MRKILLLSALVATAMSASADVEAVWFEKPASFPESGKEAVTAGTVIADGAAGTLMVGADDSWGVSSAAANNYNCLIVNGVDLGKIPSGAVGNANPQGCTVLTAPTGGAIFRLDAKKDGYVVLAGKLNAAKPFYVFEGLANQGETAVAYQYAAQTNIENAIFPNNEIRYSLPADKDGYLNVEASDIETYVNMSNNTFFQPANIMWNLAGETEPYAEADFKKDGFGVVVFPVYAEISYIYCLTGSKMISNGFVFTDEAPVVTIYGDGEDDKAVTPKTFTFFGGQSALDTIIADENANAPMYNIYGQRVNESYKGLVIKNGVKFIN